MAEETKTEKKRSRLIFRIISRTAVVLAIAGCTISIVSNQSSIAEKKTELEQVQKQIDDLTADNEDLHIYSFPTVYVPTSLILLWLL